MEDLELSYTDDAIVVQRPRNVAMVAALGIVLFLALALLIWGATSLITHWRELTEVERLFFATRIAVGLIVCIPVTAGLMDAYHPTRIVIDDDGVAMQRAGYKRSYVAWSDVQELIVDHTRTLSARRRNYRIRLQGKRERIAVSTSMWLWSVDDLRQLAFTLGRRLRRFNPDARTLDYEEWIL